MSAAKKVTARVSNPTWALVAEAPLALLVVAGALVTVGIVAVGVEVTDGTLVWVSPDVVAGEETVVEVLSVAVAVAVPFAVAVVSSEIDDIPVPAHCPL